MVTLFVVALVLGLRICCLYMFVIGFDCVCLFNFCLVVCFVSFVSWRRV